MLVGVRIREQRIGRKWTVRELSTRAGLSTGAVASIEAGEAGSVDSYARLTVALGLRMELELVDARQRPQGVARQADPVHAAMGEFELRHLRPAGHGTALDEPYQHYQFAGRADLAAWDLDCGALLHIENRTRFPDFQDMAGSFNAKRAYLGGVLATRLGVRPWRSETHVMAALWSGEVLGVIRSMAESVRAICPDPIDALEAWWAGHPPATGRTSTLVLLDPLASGRQRTFVNLDEALSARPRHRGYADVARLLARAA